MSEDDVKVSEPLGGGREPITDDNAEVRRPRPAPSPTSRARRAAAASVDAGRPRPRPAPAVSRPRPTATIAEQDDEVRTDPATEAQQPQSEPAGRPHHSGARGPLWLTIVLVAVIVLAGVAIGWLALQRSGSGSVSERDQALSAAKSEVPTILSYSYQHFDADVAKAKAALTGRAVTDYSTAMATSIKPTATKNKVVVQAQTDGAGVESVSPDGKQVTVVVFGEQKVTNSSLSAPRTDLFRVRATLDLIGGHWLVAKFDQI